MKLVFFGADRPIPINRGSVCTVEVENSCLFTRICRSIVENGGASTFESFSLWDDAGDEVASSRTLLTISDPLHLPWDNPELAGRLLTTMESFLFEDEDARSLFESHGRQLQQFAYRLAYQVESDYRFNVEWDLRRFLKSFGFAVDRGEGLPYIDTLNMFLDFVSDMKLGRVLVFVNLKTFLTENEFRQFLDRVFFREMSVLLLENKTCEISYNQEEKIRIDQHFLEI